jgi:hypothetical protein
MSGAHFRHAGLLVVLAVGLGQPLTPLHAHHAWNATYRENEEIRIQGRVVRLVSKNPHSFIYVSAPGSGGEPVIWAVECGNPTQPRQQRVEQALRPGDLVIVTGSPGRDPSLGRLRLRVIVRPVDGWQLESR